MKTTTPTFTVETVEGSDMTEFLKWYKYWHRGGFPDLLMCKTLTTVEFQGEKLCGVICNRVADANYCMFSFITRNPYCDRELSSLAVDFLIANLAVVTKSIGYKTFVSMIGEEPAKARFRKNKIRESKGTLALFWGEC